MKGQKFNIGKILYENRWVWHCCFWIFYVLYVFRNYVVTVLYFPAYLNFMLVSDLFFAGFVYLTLFLYKQLAPKSKYLTFLLLGTLLWVLFVMIRTFLMKVMMHSIPDVANSKVHEIFFSNLPIYFLFYVFVVVFKYLKDNFMLQYRHNQQQKMQMHVELENLKAQISPHFLFNTMNNFYGLAVENSKKLPGLMIRLSDLLRYSLYETQQEKVPLQDEINYLKNYIELEKIRLESTLDLEFDINAPHAEEYRIAPLLLIVFIENAFKHARTILDEPVYISVRVKVSDTGILALSVKNNYNPEAPNASTGKGIGLENAKKRLAVMYPNEKHHLNFHQDQRYYQIGLTIDLN